MTRMGTAFLPEFHEGSLTSGEHAAGHVARQVRRDRAAGRADPARAAGSGRDGAAHRPRRARRARAGRRGGGDRRRPARDRAAARRAAAPSCGAGFSTLPGTNVTIGQPISHRIDHMLSGTRANIAVKIFGDDLATLRRLGERVRDAVSGVPGVVDLSLEQQMDIPFVRFVLEPSGDRPLRPARRRRRRGDRDELRRHDRRPDLRSRHGVRPRREVRSGDAAPTSSGIADLPVDTPDRRAVPIRLLADVRREEGPNMILRENVQRRIVVSCNVAGRDLGSVVDDIRSAVAQRSPMPAGYRVEYGGQFESQQSASQAAARSGRRRARRPVHAARAGVRPVARRAAGHGQPAAGADRRRRRRVPGRRRAERRVDDRLHHAVRHRDAQRHHAGLAHPAPDGGGGRHRFPRGGRARRATSGWCRS